MKLKIVVMTVISLLISVFQGSSYAKDDNSNLNKIKSSDIFSTLSNSEDGDGRTGI